LDVRIAQDVEAVGFEWRGNLVGSKEAEDDGEITGSRGATSRRSESTPERHSRTIGEGGAWKAPRRVRITPNSSEPRERTSARAIRAKSVAETARTLGWSSVKAEKEVERSAVMIAGSMPSRVSELVGNAWKARTVAIHWSWGAMEESAITRTTSAEERIWIGRAETENS
jgi:hypothetical protein